MGLADVYTALHSQWKGQKQECMKRPKRWMATWGKVVSTSFYRSVDFIVPVWMIMVGVGRILLGEGAHQTSRNIHAACSDPNADNPFYGDTSHPVWGSFLILILSSKLALRLLCIRNVGEL